MAAHTAPFEVDAAEGGRARVSPGPRREGGGRLELARAGSCAGHVPYEVHSQRERERVKKSTGSRTYARALLGNTSLQIYVSTLHTVVTSVINRLMLFQAFSAHV